MSILIKPCLETNKAIQAVIELLRKKGLPPLPVAPAQDPYQYPKKNKNGEIEYEKDGITPKRLFTGKNPSYLDKNGKPHLISHSNYREELPTNEEIEQWFTNPQNGIGTLGGWDNVYWIDIDAKHFDNQEACDLAFQTLLEDYPTLCGAWLERTHSGGYRIGIRITNPPNFTNFKLKPDSGHVGEILGKGRFTVLAPTIGPSGNPYQNLNCPDSIPTIDIIDFLHPSKKTSDVKQSRQTKKEVIGEGVKLFDCITDKSRDILSGKDIYEDRSESLTAFIKDCWGWQNFLNSNGINFSDDAERLIYECGLSLGIDEARIERIVKGIDAESCKPSCQLAGEHLSSWKRLYKLDRTQVPEHIKRQLKSAWETNKNNQDNDDIPHNHWKTLEEHNFELGEFKATKQFFVNEQDADDYVAESPNLIKRRGYDEQQNRKVFGWRIWEFEPKADFIFHVERVIQSQEGGGCVLRVGRNINGKLNTQRVFVNDVDTHKAVDFKAAMSRGLGTPVSSTLNISEIQNYLKAKKNECYLKGGKVFRLADRIGQQADGTWVFKNCQFTIDGQLTDESKTLWVYNDRLSVDEFIPSPTICEPDSDTLPRLIDALRRFSGSSLPQCLLTLGYGAAIAHFQTIIKTEGCFPILNLYGDPGGLKSIAAESALSLFGLTKEGALSSSSESALYERLKLSGSLPIVFDDPQRDNKHFSLDEVLKRLYNAKPRVVRKNSQEPHSGVIVTTNHACGENSPATQSRLIQLHFPVLKDGNKSAWTDVTKAQQSASAALQDIIRLGYPKATIDGLENEFVQYLPFAHARIAKSFAILAFYTDEIAKLGRIKFEAKQWIIDNLCPIENDPEHNKASLTDLIEKIHILLSRSELGEWNVRNVCHNGHSYTAIVLNDVWASIERHFSPPYNLKTITSLIQQDFGNTRSVQKFYRDKDTTLSYNRLLLSGAAEKQPDWVTKRCVLIPNISLDIGATGGGEDINQCNHDGEKVSGDNNSFSYTSNKSVNQDVNQYDPSSEEVSDSQFTQFTQLHKYNVEKEAKLHPQVVSSELVHHGLDELANAFDETTVNGVNQSTECLWDKDYDGLHSGHKSATKNVTVDQAGEFKVGDTVQHFTWGTGKIEAVDPEKGIYAQWSVNGNKNWSHPMSVVLVKGVA
ncbi:MAG: bifunctional DNA primase/polymerase [Snowella sp.]|nr:bifunctional DNA primase/polymerase [Snowella sp.]